MSARTRRSFVAVVTASAASLVTATAGANPPAPSSVPDPLKLATLKTGETPHRIRRHDGGCFVYSGAGPVGKTECPKGLDQAGEWIEREPDSGECVLIEPWSGEPRDIACPAVLVPPDWSPPTAAKAASLAADDASPPMPPEPTPASTKSGCTSCELGTTSSSETVPLLGAAAAIAIAAGRRRRR